MPGSYKPGIAGSRISLAFTAASVTASLIAGVTASLTACIPKSKNGSVKVIGGKETETRRSSVDTSLILSCPSFYRNAMSGNCYRNVLNSESVLGGEDHLPVKFFHYN